MSYSSGAFSSSYPRERVTLTKQQIGEQHERCCRALFQANINPFLTGFFRTPKGLVEKVIKRTYTHDNGPEHFSFIRTRDWNSLPRVDYRRAKTMELWLKDVFRERPGVWMGVATPKAPCCTIDHVGQRRRQLITDLHKFIVDQSRYNGAQHIFSVAHETVRDRETGTLKINGEGKLLYHVHIHFLFYPPPAGKKRDRFEVGLGERFGAGSGIQEIEKERGAIVYLTAVQDRSDYLDHGEFVEWHKQVWRTPRFRTYGPLKPRSGRRRPSNRITTSHGFVPKIAKTNQFIGKTYLAKKAFTKWDSLVSPIDQAYKNQGVEREPDL